MQKNSSEQPKFSAKREPLNLSLMGAADLHRSVPVHLPPIIIIERKIILSPRVFLLVSALQMCPTNYYSGQFFHRVCDKNEGSISFTPKRRVAFKKDHLLLIRTENMKIT